MDFIYDTLTLYESAFLERVPFQLSLHLTGAIHSVITFGNKASSLVLDCFKLWVESSWLADYGLYI